jgi:UDP-N-acetylmuramate dehydrogenase
VTTSPRMLWDLPTLLREVPGRKWFRCPLRRYTSFRIGGPADALIRLEEPAALRHLQALACEHDIPLLMLGGGSNLLVRDNGIRGIVVLLRGGFCSYRIESGQDQASAESALVRAGVGCPLSQLAMRLGRQGWQGMEFAYGIPGTLGGAMVMNAGTHLGDLRQVMTAACVLLADGQEQRLSVEALGLRYRTSSYPPGAIILGATIRLQRGEPEDILAVMQAAYRRRHRTQPLWLPNAGSIFKNPPGVAAARLIDALGLKGSQIGGAMVSPQHANFIVNVDRATAADVERLMALIRRRVQKAYGITLEPEVRIVGEEKACLE